MRRDLRYAITRGVCALLSLLTLTSCALFAADKTEPNGEPEPTEEAAVYTFAPIPSAVPSGDGRFTLRYNKNATFNPLLGTDADNMLVAGLLYESLFVLNADFTPRGVLCESYETEDAKTYDFTLIEGVKMSDGEDLSPYDVIYSLNTARRNSKYSTRLRNIDTVSLVGSRVVRVTLKAADARFASLLDIPIIKDGTSGIAPRGTGPYRYEGEGETPYLARNEHHRDYVSLSPTRIYLATCAINELGEKFTERVIDFFVDNPNGTAVTVRRDHEVRYYDTTVLQFIGFNPRAAAIDDARFRAAVALAVDRDMIVRDILGTRATPAPLVFPKGYRLYDKTWETAKRTDFNGEETASDTTIQENGDAATYSSPDATESAPPETPPPPARTINAQISDLLTQIGLADGNSDTYLEFPVSGELVPFVLDFIVSNENDARVAAARSVANALRHVGLNVILRELSFEDFKIALEMGNFDIYYGETRISANLDFSPLLASDGALNYGKMTGYTEDLRTFAAARGDFAERNAARSLAMKIRDNVPFVPVAYLQYAIHTGRDEITGIVPSQSNVFWNATEWTINPK